MFQFKKKKSAKVTVKSKAIFHCGGKEGNPYFIPPLCKISTQFSNWLFSNSMAEN